jgi:endonuclease G, mitochondrial
VDRVLLKEEGTMSDELLCFNGIDGDTGTYDLPPMSAEELMRVIRGEVSPENLNELRFRVQQATTGFLGVKEGVDPTRLDEAGWGVIFPTYATSDPDREEKERRVEEICEALQPLLRLRQGQAGDRFADWCQGTGKRLRVGVDTKNAYLARHGAGPGPADPDRVPYYLLLVGSPADIPYRFQSQLDVQYAVGRIHFPTLDEYAAYASNVVAVETSATKLPRRATFFGVANSDDRATALSSAKLMQPLAAKMQAGHADWAVESVPPAQATKAMLSSLLGGEKTPSLLFTASHGMKFAKGSTRQLAHQGALLCQDWPGPRQWTLGIPQDFYFAGDDLAGDADLLGLIAFFFACYGGGTPQFNEFVLQDKPGMPASRPEIAPHPFLARLPASMLGRPRGALAVVGHVERAWSYSFDWGRAGAQTTVFESTLERLLSGHPIGSAIEYFNERYAELSTVLSDELEEIGFGKVYDPFEMAGMWTANNDARGYAIIGDPAVRLPVASAAEDEGGRDSITVDVTAPATGDASLSGPRPEPELPAGGETSFGVLDTGGPSHRFEAMLRQTEERYAEREEVREEVQAKIKAGRLLEADTPERVAKRLERLRIQPGTTLEGGPGAISFGLISGAETAEPGLLERILGTSDLMGVSFLELGLLVSRTVGRVHCRNRTGRTVAYGTGFMVSPRLMMTNNHVLDSAEMAAQSQIEFDYQIGLDGNPATSVFVNLSPADLFITDEALDYTLVAVQPPSPDGGTLNFGWNRLYDQEGKVIKGEYVNIIQHPNGEPKQLALRENQLEDALEQWLHYRTDTAPGSSGAPVYNDQWEVVALHHSGVPRRDERGNILARDGQIWQPVMGEHRIDWKANEGARVSRIVRHIKAQPLSPAAAQLRTEMFQSAPPAVLWSWQPPAAPKEQVTPPATVTVGPAEDGGVTWTIPLQVTVRVGPPAVAPVEPAAWPAAAPPPTPVPAPTRPAPQVTADVVEALAELRAASTRVYYDPEEDGRARDDYYAGLDPELEPDEMYRQLNALLKDSHATQPRYKPAKYVYPWIDLHPDLKIRSIYSGLSFDAETLILEDLAVDQERERRTAELLARESSRDMATLLEELSLLEAQLPYNCEHVVPQSWFGKLEPMRGDLHHLFACESGCNSFRGNHAYYDFPDFEEVIRNDCGKRVQNRFEPSSSRGKGAAARATLYFLLRYPGLIAAVGGEFDAERLPVLLAWHKASPPDEYERHRNAAIYALQGNRNPLIDFPEWVDGIDFGLGFGQ